MPESIEQRRYAFHGAFQDREVEYARSILHILSEVLPELLDRDAAQAAMLTAYRSWSIELPRDFAWYDAEGLPDDEVRKVPLYRDLVGFRAYAFWGLPDGPDGSIALNGDLLLAFWERGSTGRLLFPIALMADEELGNVLRAANARSLIDARQDEAETLTAEELAALAQLDIKTMKNLLTPSGRRKNGLHVNSDGTIPLQDARQWLLSRKDFLSTISGDGTVIQPSKSRIYETPDDAIFIPVADDGSAFTPDVRRDDGYFIVDDEGERAHADYIEALNMLKQMEVPTWRRPGPKGRWGLVKAVSWRRASRQELGL